MTNVKQQASGLAGDSKVANTPIVRSDQDLKSYLAKQLQGWQSADTPKYTQLSDALVNALFEGVLVEGDRLPTDTELADMTPFSLGTTQKAIQSLSDNGFFLRRRGLGTFVKAWRKAMAQPHHCRFLDESDRFVAVYSRVLDRRLVLEDGPWKESLGDRARVYRIDRLIHIGDYFNVYAAFYVDTLRFPLFATEPIEDFEAKNFKSLIRESSGEMVARLDQRLSLTSFPDSITNLLDMRSDSIGLSIKAIALAGSGRPIYYQEIFIPPNDLQLSMQSSLDTLSDF